MKPSSNDNPNWPEDLAHLVHQQEVAVTVARNAEKGSADTAPGPSPFQGFTGTVNLQLTDLLQMFCLSRADLTIRVRSGHKSGAIHVRSGQIFHVETETLLGEEAFFEIFRWPDGQFEMLPFQETGIESLDKPWEHLLLEAMRQRDEGTTADAAAAFDNDFDEELPAATGSLALEQELDGVFDQLELIAQSQSLEMLEDSPEPRSHLQQEKVVRVLVVDDSTFFARQLKNLLEAHPDIEVAAIAKNGQEALELLATLPPVDLITLDINMPVMQGDTALKHIMIRHPIPVLIISTFQPQSLGKIFEFLQVGAIDFFPKPHAREDLAVYGERLRLLVKKAARAEVSHFRRWRKAKSAAVVSTGPAAPSGHRVLAVFGAEGAYLDWFRLPLANLCRRGLVMGFQQLPDPFLAGFCQLIEEETSAKTEPLARSQWIRPGCFYLGTASQPVELSFVRESASLSVETLAVDGLEWPRGVDLWLTQLAEQVRDRLSIYFLSAAHALAPDLIEHLVECGTQLILAPRDVVLCTQLIDSMNGYAQHYPQQIFRGTPENLMEVWLRDECNG